MQNYNIFPEQKKCLHILNFFIDFGFAFQYYVGSLLQ